VEVVVLAVLRRIVRDLANRRNIEAYAVAVLAFVFAVLSVISDVVPDDMRWAVLFAGIALLVYRLTLPGDAGAVDEVLLDRSSFDSMPFADRLAGAEEVWVYAPSAVNLLDLRTSEALRCKVLARKEGVVRIVVLDPDQPEGVRVAVKQLDQSVDYPVHRLESSLVRTIEQLRLMMAWPVPGSLRYRLLDYNPGFSLVAVDPGRRHGRVIVEFHAFHNETTTSRMHIELSRSDSPRWFAYWVDQFDLIWHAARTPEEGAADVAGQPAVQGERSAR